MFIVSIHYYAKFLTHAKIKIHVIVAYTSLMYAKKIHQFLSSIKRDAQHRKLVPFFLPHGVHMTLKTTGRSAYVSHASMSLLASSVCDNLCTASIAANPEANLPKFYQLFCLFPNHKQTAAKKICCQKWRRLLLTTSEQCHAFDNIHSCPLQWMSRFTKSN